MFYFPQLKVLHSEIKLQIQLLCWFKFGSTLYGKRPCIKLLTCRLVSFIFHTRVYTSFGRLLTDLYPKSQWVEKSCHRLDSGIHLSSIIHKTSANLFWELRCNVFFLQTKLGHISQFCIFLSLFSLTEQMEKSTNNQHIIQISLID